MPHFKNIKFCCVVKQAFLVFFSPKLLKRTFEKRLDMTSISPS